MQKKYFLKKISNYMIVGGLGSLLVTNLTGCGDNNNQNNQNQNSFTQASQKQGAFVVIEQNEKGNYSIVEEFPSNSTTILLRENGTERILSKEEIDKLMIEESNKIDQGTSTLTNNEQVSSSDGLGLGSIILASMAGTMLGSFIGNKLFNNSNYQNKRKAGYKSPQTYSKSVNSFAKAKQKKSFTKSKARKKKGFFSRSKSSRRSRGFFGG